ncbi:MAG: hypothetical protein ACRCYV_03945, partial [Aeromonas sp.]
MLNTHKSNAITLQQDNAALIEANKLLEKKKPAKAITLLRDRLKKSNNSDLYKLLAFAYMDEENQALAAWAFAMELENYHGDTPPEILFIYLKDAIIGKHSDPQQFIYELALKKSLGLELRYQLFYMLEAMRSAAQPTDSNYGETEREKLFKSIVDEIKTPDLADASGEKNKDVTILCDQFIDASHKPTLMALDIAKKQRSMGYNPIIVVSNSTKLNEKYQLLNSPDYSFIYEQHADFCIKNDD